MSKARQQRSGAEEVSGGRAVQERCSAIHQGQGCSNAHVSSHFAFQFIFNADGRSLEREVISVPMA